MSAHRLPVYSPPSLAADAYQAVPKALPGRAIAVLDPSDGALCLAFAARLAHALRERGCSIPVALVAFERAPALSGFQRDAFAPGQSLHALSSQADAQEIVQMLGSAAHGLWVVVGQAALSFAPALSILVGMDAPVLRWPDALREARPRVSLGLSGDGLAVASALAQALIGDRCTQEQTQGAT